MSLQDQIATAWFVAWLLTLIAMLIWARRKNDVTLDDVMAFGMLAMLWPLLPLIFLIVNSSKIVCLKKRGKRG